MSLALDPRFLDMEGWWPQGLSYIHYLTYVDQNEDLWIRVTRGLGMVNSEGRWQISLIYDCLCTV